MAPVGLGLFSGEQQELSEDKAARGMHTFENLNIVLMQMRTQTDAETLC